MESLSKQLPKQLPGILPLPPFLQPSLDGERGGLGFRSLIGTPYPSTAAKSTKHNDRAGGEGMTAGGQPARPHPKWVWKLCSSREEVGPLSVRALLPSEPPRLAPELPCSPWETRDEGVLEDGWGLQRTMQTLSISQPFPES